MSKCIALLQVILQLFMFALPSYAFSFSGNENTNHVVIEESTEKKELYLLKKNETVYSLSKKYYISVEDLWLLNKSLFNNHDDFLAIKMGGYIYLPDHADASSTSASSITENSLPALGSESAVKMDNTLPVSADKIVSTSQQLANGNGDLSNVAGSYVNSLLTEKSQAFLNQYGTSRIRMSTDNGLMPRLEEIDVLLPFTQRDDRVDFTQMGYRHTDGRDIINIGAGQRHYYPQGWMLGYNVFYDRQVSGNQHQRVGVGAEVWRDYFKFSTNGYFAISDWKTSSDFYAYDERPANGWDVSSEFWLPDAPQWGGKFKYEQYYGQNVALTNKDERYNNPNSFTLGVNYTPFPLLTLGADYSLGDNNDKSINLQFSYALGVPWAEQINPDNIKIKRSLAGNRLDLVERNNTIVLDYKNRQSVSLNIADTHRGNHSSWVKINYSVQATHGLSHVEWIADELISAGGAIEERGNGDYYILLPALDLNLNSRAARTAISYPLTGIAVDTKNLRSESAVSTVIINGSGGGNASMASDRAELSADGQDNTAITILIQDTEGQPASGLADEIKLVLTENIATQKNNLQGKASRAMMSRGSVPMQASALSAIKEIAPGTYVSTLTAGTQQAQVNVAGHVYDLPIGQVNVSLVTEGGSANIDETDLNVDKTQIIANGSDLATFTAKVTNQFGTALEGVTVVWQSNRSDVQLSATETATGRDGFTRITASSVVAGAAQISATVGDNPALNAPVIMFIPDRDNAQVLQQNLTHDKEQAVADGSDAITYTARVTDTDGNPVSGVDVIWNNDLPNSNLGTRITRSNADGYTTNTLTSSRAGQALVSVTIRDNGKQQTDTAVTFIPQQPADQNTSLSVTPDSITADGQTRATLSFLVRDQNNNPIPGLANQVLFSEDTTGGSHDIMFSQVVEASLGVYQATLTATKEGTATLLARVSGSSLSEKSVTLRLSADARTARIVEITTDKLSAQANGTDEVVYTAFVKDQNNNNALPNVAIGWQSTIGTFNAPLSYTDTEGKATIRLHSTKAGVAQVRATIDGVDSRTAPDVTFMAGDVSLDNSRLVLNPTIITADGLDVATLRIFLKDNTGNPLSGLASSIVVSPDALADSMNISSAVENNAVPGLYLVSIKGTKAGQTALKTTVQGMTFTQQPTLSLIGDSHTAKVSVVSVDKRQIIAGKETATYSATVIDNNGNPLAGMNVSWHLVSGVANYPRQSLTNAQGIAESALTSTQAAVLSMDAAINQTQASAPTVTVIADSIDFTQSTFTADRLAIGVSSGDDISTLRVTLADQYKNPIINQSVTLTDSGLNVNSVVITPTTKVMTDNQDGSYSATLSASQQGVVNVNAHVAGITFSNSLDISVGAQAVHLSFDNARETAVYTKNYTGSQAVRGLPNGVRSVWDSSNPEVATVDNTGKVTLLKAGETSILVHSFPNGQYSSGDANYKLTVTLADPSLSFAKTSDTVYWGETVVPQRLIIGNSDVNDGDLALTWTSSNPNVATIDNRGVITLVRPGTTTIKVDSQPTPQFASSSANYVLVVNKGRVSITFREPQQEVPLGSPMVVQQPIVALPTGVDSSWGTSNSAVLTINPNGSNLVNHTAGQSEVRLTVTENDFYSGATGAYSVIVHGSPVLVNPNYSYLNRDNKIDNGTSWRPAWTTDNLTAKWSYSSNPLEKPSSVVAKLVDAGNGQTLSTQNIPSTVSEAVFIPETGWFGKRVRIELVPVSNYPGMPDGDKFTSSTIQVSNMAPDEIWNRVSLARTIKIRYTDMSNNRIMGESSNKSCRWNLVVAETGLFLEWDALFDIPVGKQVLGNFTVNMRNKVTGNGKDSTFSDSVQFTNETINSRTSKNYSVNQSGSAVQQSMHTLCWNNHNGAIAPELTVRYNGQNYSYRGPTMNYVGDPVNNQSDIVEFKP